MTVIIFILVLFVLILAHEWGHFAVAKYFGIRVDEFGIGFPPKAVSLFKKNGTEYTLNWLPLGGFVKIYGENYEDVENGKKLSTDSFASKSKWIQAAVLVAGVIMNFLLAWVLIAFSFASGVPASVSSGVDIVDAKLTVIEVDENSPASLGGLLPGDAIVSFDQDGVIVSSPTPEIFQEAIRSSGEESLSMQVQRQKEILPVVVSPVTSEGDEYPSIGISMDLVGLKKLPLGSAFVEGFTSSVGFSKSIIIGFFGIFTGSTDLQALTGPVGIAGVVGEASRTGATSLMLLMAVISLNLAVLNLIPFPALDGGRLLFVGIEAIIRKPIPAKIFSITNAVGFFLLVGLMILVSIRDVINLF